MKKALYIIIAISVLVGLPMYSGLKERKEERDKKSNTRSLHISRFDNWKDSLDVCIFVISMKDTIDVISSTPLEECALAVNVDKNIEMLNFKYDGGLRYVLDISKSSFASQGQKFSFIITKHKEPRSSFAMTRDEFIEEFPTLERTLILKQLN